MTESESVALPFGDSPSTQRLYYTIRYSPRQALFPYFFYFLYYSFKSNSLNHISCAANDRVRVTPQTSQQPAVGSVVRPALPSEAQWPGCSPSPVPILFRPVMWQKPQTIPSSEAVFPFLLFLQFPAALPVPRWHRHPRLPESRRFPSPSSASRSSGIFRRERTYMRFRLPGRLRRSHRWSCPYRLPCGIRGSALILYRYGGVLPLYLCLKVDCHHTILIIDVIDLDLRI